MGDLHQCILLFKKIGLGYIKTFNLIICFVCFYFCFVEDKDVRMYQKECEALRQQFLQKDAFIEKLRADKGAMQVRNVAHLLVVLPSPLSISKRLLLVCLEIPCAFLFWTCMLILSLLLVIGIGGEKREEEVVVVFCCCCYFKKLERVWLKANL